ncbi:FxSxx-COOH system tetratricopeptide repeat protein [Spirillospora sp. CA-294931]|uniref:FxSxx-COOH system tetratricopeptide repeat protein n=1 Tax=Spirillospora sp. CA-294931 TaxID=3240042 RepID=UPI003D8F960C
MVDEGWGNTSDVRATAAKHQIWGREVPFRNPHFTGRAAELTALRERLTGTSTVVVGQPATPLFGLGGVGKTEIAAEYCHRFAREYSLVWWIRAEQEDTIRNALIALGRRMGLPDFHSNERDYSAQVVLDALRAGDPYDRWLLVFDNAVRPEIVSRYMPQGNGHVIVTSRIAEWRRSLRSEGIEVAEFSSDETVTFLRKRVDALGASDDEATERARRGDAERLARALDNLPLAAEHAAAYLVETGTPVDQYLELFERNAHELMGLDVDIFYPHAVATTWSVSRSTISPDADALFQLLAFFSPEPISEEILVQPGRVSSLPDSLRDVLGDLQKFRRAGRELARFSLIKIFGVRNVVQMHRVVQAVTRGRIEREDAESARELRGTVHTLLAASDPGSPEHEESDPIYERSRHHLVSSGALESGDPLVRALIIHQVRRMYLRGGHDESLSLGEPALALWRELFGENDLQTLWLAVEVASALRRKGRFEETRELISDTLERLRVHHGEANDAFLRGSTVYATSLRMLGRYQEAYDHDTWLLPLYERHMRPEHPSSLDLRNNLAIDLRCLGRFQEALETDEATLRTRESTLGPTHSKTLNSRFALARDLRKLGRYEESLDLLRDVTATALGKDEPWHLGRLLTEADMAVALRRVGFYQDARAEGERALARHTAILGPTHRQTLTISINLINDRRLTDDLAGAQELGEATLQTWEKVAGADHPNTLAAVANLAVVLRARANPSEARDLDERARDGMLTVHGEDHPNVIVVSTNLASDLAALGEVRLAAERGERTLETSKRVMGASHPCTLAAAANLALDRRAIGDQSGADALFEETYRRYVDELSSEHPMALRVLQRGRIDLDIEPSSV